MNRIVLGIDPGLAHLGWAVLADGTFVAGGILRTNCTPADEREAAGISKGADKMRRAQEIGSFLDSTISIFQPSLVAHEAISLGFHQPTTLFEMGLAFGAIAAAAAGRGIARVEVRPARIKAWARPGAKGVDKEDVIAAAQRAFPDVPWPRARLTWQHLADALAAAHVAWGAHESMNGAPPDLTPPRLSHPFPPADSLAPAVAAHLPELPPRVRGQPRPEHGVGDVNVAAVRWRTGALRPGVAR